MFKRIWNSRESRKFRRNKTAVFALFVILLYFVTAMVVLFGAITKDDCAEIVGGRNLPGFFRQQIPEKRYDTAVSGLFTQTERALKRNKVEAALAGVELGKLRVRQKRDEVTDTIELADGEKTIEELQKIIDEANAIREEISKCPDLDQDPSMMPTLVRLEEKVAELAMPLTAKQKRSRNMSLWLGTDSQGRSIFYRGIYSIRIALLIGLVTATISVFIGALLGAIGGYFGGWVDHIVVWIYTTFSSIPSLVLLVVIAYAFTDSKIEIPFTSGGKAKSGRMLMKDTLIPVYIAFCATFWIGTCRVIRGETMKLRNLEYVQAARTSGFGSLYILIRHVLPNTAHLMLINFSLLLIGAIKSEVILSFLGLGVKSQPSWGIMIKDANGNSEVINGFFWQIGTATALMFVLVLAFNILSDALQDALDPKHL